MQIDFKTEMAKRTDEELIQVLTVDKDEYLPDALAAAKEEFEKRDLRVEKISVITKDIAQKKEIENKKANEPLDIVAKALTFLFPVIITLVLSLYYRSSGYDRKARELVIWTLLGFCFYALIILISFLL